jgi:hypothetical protein
MQFFHLLIVFITIFIWIFSLPIMVILSFFFLPFILPFSVLSFLLSLYIINLKPCSQSLLRDLLTGFHLDYWFPCNRITVARTTVIAVHPHGLLACGALAGIHFVSGSETLFCVAPVLYFVPLLGHCLNLLGCIPATRVSMELALVQGHSLIVVPGGVPELVLSETNNDTEFYQRFGFLKLAEKFKLPVLSVFVKGETATYNMIQLPCLRNRVKLSWLLNIPFMFPLISGYFGTWIPKRVQLELRSHMHENVPIRKKYHRQLRCLCNQ